MHQGEDQDQDQQPEDWLGAYEEDDIDELQQEPNLEEKLLSEKDLAEQHLFLTFQNSATAIAQLYKGIFNQICIIFLITEWVVFFVLLLTVVAKLGRRNSYQPHGNMGRVTTRLKSKDANSWT